MDATLLRSLVGLAPAFMLFVGSAVRFSNARNMPIFLQVIGTTALVIVIVAHICEALQLLPSMGWGLPDSAGHYLDLISAIAALALFPLGYLWAGFRMVKIERLFR